MTSLKLIGFFYFFFLFFKVSGSEKLQPVVITKHISTSEGLGSKTIYSIVQDHTGFLWFGTDAGVFRYDGNVFKRYTVDDGLSDNEVLKLFVDKKGRVWFLTYNGYLSFYYQGIIYNSKNAPFLKKTYVGGSYVDAMEDDGKLWLCSFKRGFISVDDTTVDVHMIESSRRGGSYPTLIKGKDNKLWFFSDYVIRSMDSQDSIQIPDYPFASCSIGGLSDILFISSKGVYRIHDLKLETYIDGNTLPDYTKVVSIFYEKEDDNLWVCTLGKGATLFHKKKFVKTYFPNSSVTGMLRDKEGNIWITTMNDGVYVCYKNNTNIVNYDKSSGLPDNKVYSLAIDSSSNLWLGYYNGEVDRISESKKSVFNLTTWNHADYLRTMSIISNDTMWCGNDGGIYFITKEKVHRILYPDLQAVRNNYSIKHLMIDEMNNVFGAFSFNLLKVNKSKEGFYASNVFDSLMRVFASVKTKDGRFYISTINGLIEYLPGKFIRKLSSDYDFSTLRILDMKIDKSGDLLLATNVNGIFVMRNSRVVQHITTDSRLSDNSCRRLWLEDSLVYICTQSGLNIFVRHDEKWVYKDEISMHDGILDNSINDVATKGNLIYVATDGGVSIVDKKIFSYSNFIGDVYISELLLEKPYQIMYGSVSFKSTVPRFIVRYSYPVFNPANRILYRYRLRPADGNADWLNTTNNEIQFSSLEPGKYIFEVMPFGGEKVSKLLIDVLPMWWQTFTARIILVVGILLLITIIIRQWTQMQFEKRLRLLKEKQVIETERSRIASDMHDDIGADLTQISIWSNVLKNNSANSHTLVQRISYLSNEVLSKMDQIIWALNSVNNQSGDLIAYLHSYSEEYLENNNIQLQFSLQDNIPDVPMTAFQRRNIFLVLKELLHNTLKHSHASVVKISISFQNNEMIISYHDNGHGFELDTKSDGLGLSTMVKRMEEINSTMIFESGSLQGMKAILTINFSEQSINS